MAVTTLGSKPVKSIVKIKIGGVAYEFIIIHQGRPSGLYDSNCNGTWVLIKDVYVKGQWNSGGSSDYENSEVNSYLNNTFLNLIDANIRGQIKPAKIPYRAGSGVSQTISSGANGLLTKIFLLSAIEVGYTAETLGAQNFLGDGKKLDYFQQGSGTPEKIANYNGAASNWWLRTPSISGTGNGIRLVGSGGLPVGSYGDAEHGIRPAFILPSTLFVSDDGTVFTNTAPGTPSSISVPDTINGGSTITVSWGASTDTENNLEGYIVERSVDGGSTWSQIYQGSGRSTTNTVAFGTPSVMYRVKAYDTEGLQSGWRTSSQITVINNNAPTAPDGLNVPEKVNAGQAFTITWGAASDSDGDLAGYSLERQLDGGNWAEVYNGTGLTYTDTLERGWNSVAYRVRAYDVHTAYSAYVTSGARAVNNNLAPVISGQDSALGLKTGSFSQTYTVTDAENDTVTVTESVDGMEIRSRVELGKEQAVTVPHELWLVLPNGDHKLQVTASDGNADSRRVWTFSKRETVISFRLAAPEETDEAVKKVVLSPTWQITGAEVKVEACNNAFDEAPAWEDITAMVLLNRVYNFLNTAKTAAKWGFDLRFTITKNEGYDGEVSITGFGGAYE